MYIKRLYLIVFFLFLFFYRPQVVSAQVLFSDNFDDGDANGWIVPRNTCNSSWQINNNTYGIVINSGCVTETIPENLVIATDLNYSFEVDLTMSQSANMDRNFVFKYTDSSNWYDLHLIGSNIYLQKVVGGNVYTLPNSQFNYDFVADNTYHFKVDVINNSEYRIYIDNILVNTVPEEAPYLDNYSVGLQASAGGIPSSQVWFDNIVVTQLPVETPTPTPSPSPTPTDEPTESPSPSPTPISSPSPSPSPSPTASPSATPTSISLNVPSLKQYQEPWRNKIYAFTKNTIREFGCALTSSAMILQYHGHNITPDALNKWLKDQPDGYIRNGLINWLAVSRYTKLHDSTNSPTLEYKRLAGTTENLVDELSNNRPAILKESGHFVVAKSILPDTFGINDPGYANRNDLTPYGNSFLAINSYIPSHSDLSYMMFVIDPAYTLNLYDSNNNLINSQSFIEEPINNLLNQNKKSGDNLKVLIYPKPENGKYHLKVSGPKGKYNLDSYLYDVSGKVTKNNFSNKLDRNDIDKFDISFEGKKRINEKEKKSDSKFWFKNWFDHFKYFRDHD